MPVLKCARVSGRLATAGNLRLSYVTGMMRVLLARAQCGAGCEAAVPQRAEPSLRAAVAQWECSISTDGSPGMLRRKGIFLAVARWDRTGAS